ncbi:hypothetical protein PMAYCL1PPCAC_25665, partial [Pristionchus mayeri]
IGSSRWSTRGEKRWRTMWMPLLAFAIIEDINIITLFWASLVPIIVFSSILLLLFVGKSAQETFGMWTNFGWCVIMLPCSLCNQSFGLGAFLAMPDGGTNVIARTKAHESLAINASLIYIIFILFIFLSGQRTANILSETYLLFFFLTGGTLYGVKCAREAGWVENEDLVVYFKTIALIAVLLCGPHLYPGLNVHRSSALLSFVLLEVIPVALAGIYLLAVRHCLERYDRVKGR